MSRGLGRAQKGVLDVLKRGSQDVDTLALHVDISSASVRRALRTLRREGRVCFLGRVDQRRGIWCLSEHEAEARAALLPPELVKQIRQLMGAHFARRLARAHLSAYVSSSRAGPPSPR